MRVLVFGGTGYVGKNLVPKLLNSGYEVTSLARQPINLDGVQNIVIPEFEITLLTQVLENQQFDVFINLAAVGVKPTDRNISELLKINVMLPQALVPLASACGAKGILHVGSCSEYAANINHARINETHALETSKLYGSTKAAGGILALAQGRHQDINVVVTRLFNVYGSGEATHRLLPSLIEGIKSGIPTKLSKGTQIRDFIHIKDVVDGLIHILNLMINRSIEYEVVNLCTGTGNSVADFCKIAVKHMKQDESMLHFGALEMRPDEYPSVVGNNTLLSQKYGWDAKIFLEEGICLSLSQNKFK